MDYKIFWMFLMDSYFDGILISSVFEVLGSVQNGEPAYLSSDAAIYPEALQGLSAKGVFVRKADGSIIQIEDFSLEVVGRVEQKGKLFGYDIRVVPGGKSFGVPKLRLCALCDVIPFSNAYVGGAHHASVVCDVYKPTSYAHASLHGKAGTVLTKLPACELVTGFVPPKPGNKIYTKDLMNYWDYHNPDGEAGGQYVRNIFSFETVLEAAEKTGDPDEFFDYIGSICKQKLIDIDNPEFAEFDKEFRAITFGYNQCDMWAMDSLIDEARK
jgi:hypothetical protein